MLLLKRLGQQAFERVRWQVVAPSVNWAATRGLKESTGIVGLPVDPEARKHLKEKMEAVLKALHIIPADVVYRKHVEAFVEPRLADVNSDMTDEELEQKYGLQLEEHIELYNDELDLIPKMAEWKPWDVPEGYVVPELTPEDVDQLQDGKEPLGK